MPRVSASQGWGGSRRGPCGAADKQPLSLEGQRAQHELSPGMVTARPLGAAGHRQPGGRPAAHRGALGLLAASVREDAELS